MMDEWNVKKNFAAIFDFTICKVIFDKTSFANYFGRKLKKKTKFSFAINLQSFKFSDDKMIRFAGNDAVHSTQ